MPDRPAKSRCVLELFAGEKNRFNALVWVVMALAVVGGGPHQPEDVTVIARRRTRS